MADKRKRLYRDLIIDFTATHAELLQTYIPCLSQIELMGVPRAPVGAFATDNVGGRAFEALWRALLMRPGRTLKPEPDDA